MSARTYGIVVTIWVVAAAVSVFGTLQRRATEQGALEATTPVEPWARAPASFEITDELPPALQGVAIEPVHDGWEGPGGHSFEKTF